MAHAFPPGARRHNDATTTRPAIRPDPTRVVAQAGVIVVHVVALMLLLTPARIQLPETPGQAMTVWIPPPLVQPPPPIETRPPEHVPVSRAPPVRLPPTALVVDSQPGDLPAPPDTVVSDPAPSFDTGPAIASPPDLSPMTGASLAYAKAPAPRYPPKAVREGRSGTVLLDITVGTDGKPLEVAIARSSGHRDLDQAALRQVLRHWRFQPAMRDGHAVVAVGRVPVVFKL